MIDWLFRRHKAPAPEVEEAVEKRDHALRVLDDAIDVVDRAHGRALADYESAERAQRKR